MERFGAYGKSVRNLQRFATGSKPHDLRGMEVLACAADAVSCGAVIARDPQSAPPAAQGSLSARNNKGVFA